MTDDLRLPTPDAHRVAEPATIDLVAVPDDPNDAEEVTVFPDDADENDVRTTWITVHVDDLVDVQAMR